MYDSLKIFVSYCWESNKANVSVIALFPGTVATATIDSNFMATKGKSG